MIERIQVIATAAVTYITLAGVLLQSVADELGDHFPSIVEPVGRALIAIGVAVAIIRRVSPVYADERGVV